MPLGNGVPSIHFGQRAVGSHFAGPARVRVRFVELVFEGADGAGVFGHDGGAAMLMAGDVPLQAGKDPLVRIERAGVQNIRVDEVPQALPAPHDLVPPL